MPLDEPIWWYAQAAGPVPRLLAPAARLYGWLAGHRLARAASYRSRLPVICIGNFTAGGTGKTPLALHLARELLAGGRRPAFLTRGYGGRIRGPHLVRSDVDNAAAVGDEPLLLAAAAPVMVARDRRRGAQALEALPQPGPDVILMDDGLQNPALAKDLTIAVVDARRWIGNGRVIPAGPLRAPLAAQLARADAIVINWRGRVEPQEQARLAASLRPAFQGPVLAASTVAVGATEWLAGLPVVAFAAIGAPQRFFDTLAGLGARIVHQEVFADHHAFGEAEAQHLIARARRLGATLVTTQKDLVRLTGRTGSAGELREAARAVSIAPHFAPGDQVRLSSLIKPALARHGGAGAHA